MPFFLLIILVLPVLSGCASAPLEVITCTPPHADIYWGPTASELKKTQHKTPFSREISGSEWEPWCYQVKKDGYHDSRIVCRDKEKSRYINFNLDPLIPRTRNETEAAAPDRARPEAKVEKKKTGSPPGEPVEEGKASRKDNSPQARKGRPRGSQIVTEARETTAQKVSPKPKPQKEAYVISGSRLTLTWDDASSDEVGFEIERKEGTEGLYRKIGTVGANVTEYPDNELKPGTVYYYRVRAYTAKGLYSDYGNEIRVETSPH